MCSKAKCKACGLTTWTGCGLHIDSVKRGVPDAEWCKCPADKRDPEGGCVVS
jgi:hypothetical protein